MKKIAANRNYKIVKAAGDKVNAPKLADFVSSLKKDGWDVKLTGGSVSATMAWCNDGTDDCNKKTLHHNLTLTKGDFDESGDGTYAEMTIDYQESWYKSKYVK
jgi:serine protease inhibitor